METVLTLRDRFPIEHFFAIRFIIDYPERTIGHLIYIRKSEGYDSVNGDAIDEAILEAIKSFAPNAERIFKMSLITQQEYEHALHITRGNVQKDMVFQFFPSLGVPDYTQLLRAGNISAVTKQLKMTFWSNKKELLDYLPDQLIAYIPNSMIQALRSIQHVDEK